MLKNQRGNANILLLCLLIMAIPLFAMAYDMGTAQAIKIKARHDLNLACRAASNQVDRNALADPDQPRVIILPTAAGNAYNKVLQSNMRLDTANNPLSGSMACGTVQTVHFMVINSDSLPYTFTSGDFTETITRPSVTATITFPVAASAFLHYATGRDHFDLSVHSTVGPEIRPAH